MVTAEQLAHAYIAGDPQGRVTPALKNALGQLLREYGFGSRQVKVDGAPRKLWLLVGKIEEWESTALAAEYRKAHARLKV